MIPKQIFFGQEIYYRHFIWKGDLNSIPDQEYLVLSVENFTI